MSIRMERVPDIIWRKIDDNVVIVKEDGTELVTLNSTATYIWDKCDGKMNAEDIAAAIEEQFTASFEEIYNDVLAAMNRLEDMGLLKKADE